ncbi:uncharacterized protein Z520_03066 [Fonsecaea multimorphosa CBS 102226]|uniref:Uncharacterized protein n=1 Tax=Fonsecaea multimorphosa CBS 102226 TaxID=1442371 RepID=A0A0D2KXG3_9EURO|nr:uncharacterized protein Z520_03066 [Fonsecaea multimorphosa CBS 102226]KIY01514.1 hypothetical protein Z520_03066 [Fonsecaea multimorphosa CBS 102226]
MPNGFLSSQRPTRYQPIYSGGYNDPAYYGSSGEALLALNPSGKGASVAAGNDQDHAYGYPPAQQHEFKRPTDTKKKALYFCLLILTVLVCLGALGVVLALHYTKKKSTKTSDSTH